jgi:hypothetical protein
MFRSPTERVHRYTTRVVGRPRIQYHRYHGDRIRFYTHVSFGYPWYRYRYGHYHYYRPVVRIYGHSYYPTYYYDPYYYDYFAYPPVVRVVTPAPQVVVEQVGVPSSPTVTYTEAPVRQTAQEKLIDDLMRGANEDRSLAAEQLGQYKNISAVAALLDALINDGSDEVRAAAARSLGAIADPAAYEALLRAAAAEMLGDAKKEMEAAAERIRTTVGEENLYVSPKMPPMNQGDEKLGQHLEELRFGNAKVREEAADALEKYPGTQTTAALINILINDYNAPVREEAAESFQKLRDRMALPFLKWAQLNDPNKEVRKDAEKAVEKIYGTIQ